MTKPSPKILKRYARDMRNHSTKGEIRLWSELLRGRSMHGYQFLRQYPIDYYIADFACRKLRLIIEVDGYSHNFKRKEDQRRTEYLNTLGYTVIRFTEKEVKTQIAGIGRAIEDYIEEFEKGNVLVNPELDMTSPELNRRISGGTSQSPRPAVAGSPPFPKGDHAVNEL